MDYIKAQCELLKEYGEQKESKSYVTKTIDAVYASVTGCWFVKIPTEKYLLNLPENHKFQGFEKLLKWIENGNAEVVEVTNTTTKLKACTAVKIHCEKFDVWVNKKILSLFGTPSKLKILALDNMKPIYIYDNVTNELLGVVGAIRMA